MRNIPFYWIWSIDAVSDIVALFLLSGVLIVHQKFSLIIHLFYFLMRDKIYFVCSICVLYLISVLLAKLKSVFFSQYIVERSVSPTTWTFFSNHQ